MRLLYLRPKYYSIKSLRLVNVNGRIVCWLTLITNTSRNLFLDNLVRRSEKNAYYHVRRPVSYIVSIPSLTMMTKTHTAILT